MSATGQPASEFDHHPAWCALGERCDDSESARHLGMRTRWMPSRDDVQLTLELARIDSLRVRTGVRDVGDQRLCLTVTSTASVNHDGSPVTADVDLTPADARRMADLLGRYADAGEGSVTDLDRRDIVVVGLDGAV